MNALGYNIKDLKLINLTTHPVVLVDDEDKVLYEIPSDVKSGKFELPRIRTEKTFVGYINGIRVTTTNFVEVENIPQPKKGTIYIVSMLVASSANEREDLFAPDELVYDTKGKVKFARGLTRSSFNPMKFNEGMKDAVFLVKQPKKFLGSAITIN